MKETSLGDMGSASETMYPERRQYLLSFCPEFMARRHPEDMIEHCQSTRDYMDMFHPAFMAEYRRQHPQMPPFEVPK
jgi:hypothetical protein